MQCKFKTTVRALRTAVAAATVLIRARLAPSATLVCAPWRGQGYDAVWSDHY